eukprot:TRINITY_DN8692_c0_g1_i12.p2 TRINITY_DN8692_c0_g1~~TRINITY_DN8692_c0_g1_i12.p2  ORF type:complete len:102 (-),score=21.89 TRINITY_DN8692_c0_g1_i12:410-715(-)
MCIRDSFTPDRKLHKYSSSTMDSVVRCVSASPGPVDTLHNSDYYEMYGSKGEKVDQQSAGIFQVSRNSAPTSARTKRVYNDRANWHWDDGDSTVIIPQQTE